MGGQRCSRGACSFKDIPLPSRSNSAGVDEKDGASEAQGRARLLGDKGFIITGSTPHGCVFAAQTDAKGIVVRQLVGGWQ